MIDVVEVEMKLAAAMNSRRAVCSGRKFPDSLFYQCGIVSVLGIGMGRRDNICGAAVTGRLQHGDALFHAARTIVYVPNDVAVYVGHAAREIVILSHILDALEIRLAARIGCGKPDFSTGSFDLPEGPRYS